MSWNVNRRDFLRVVSTPGLVGGAGLTAGCYPRRDPLEPEYLSSRIHQPPEQTPGVAVLAATTCRECPAGCGVVARLREGRLVKVEGNPLHPLSGGALCARGQAAPQGLYNPDRLASPLMRGPDGAMRPVPWDQAIAEVARVLDQLRSRPQSVAWLTGEVSDSDEDLIAMVAEAWGCRPPLNLRLLPETPLAKAAADLFGVQGVPEFDLGAATLLVSVGADFLETWGNQVAQIRGFTAMHAYRDGARGRAVYVGPRQSNTAAKCDAWVRLAPGHEAAALRVLCEGVLAASRSGDTAAARIILDSFPLAQAEQVVGAEAQRLRALGEELAAAEAPLVLATASGPDAKCAQALALLATHLAGGTGRTLRFPATPRSPRGDDHAAVQSLLEEVRSNAVQALFIHSANPAFLLPGAREALREAAFVVCFGTQHDETADLADMVLPIHHPFETWGDHAAAAGVIGLMQPVMLPVPKQPPVGVETPEGAVCFDSRPFADALLAIDQARATPALRVPWSTAETYHAARVMAHLETTPAFAAGFPPGIDPLHEAKRRGVLVAEVPDAPVVLRTDARLARQAPAQTGLLVWLFPHPYHFEGRGADKPWLLETPETSTSAVWCTWAEIHPETAAALGVGESDGVGLQTEGGAEIEVPVLVTPQVMPGVVAVPIGLGHERLGRWGTGIGANPLRLTTVAPSGENLALHGFAVQARALPRGGQALLRTGATQDQRGRELAQAVSLSALAHAHPEHVEQGGLYPEHPHPDHMWGMVIDLDACVGCGACVVACTAENNVPVVGPERVREGREMAWIRIEKYVEPGDDVRLLVNLCQHCHTAPCEPVCPVHAAYHTVEGLNAQVYNRCVGTRYCSNNCPYKVRRFNWFDHTVPPPMNLLYNPDVTVRERGVMEKCTFCEQRIRAGKEQAKRAGDPDRLGEFPVPDGAIVPACAQTCPAQAILFGDLKRDDHRVTPIFERDPRAYALLGGLGTQPSVRYLKKVLRTETATE